MLRLPYKAFKDLQYETLRFPWRRQSGIDLKLYFSYVKNKLIIIVLIIP